MLTFKTTATLTTTLGAVNFSGSGGTLGAGGNNPTIKLNGPKTSGLIGPFATVNGTDFAAYDLTNGVAAAGTASFASAGSTDAGLLTATTTISGGNKTVASLKIAPSAAGQTLDLTDTSNLNSPGVLLAGANDFEIRDTSGGTGKLSVTGTQYFYVQQSTLTVSVPVASTTGLMKSGAGTLVLNAPNTYAGPTILAGGSLRTTLANLSPNSAIAFRGGVLETSGNFNASLGAAAGNVSWQGSAGSDKGSGGFAAVGGDLMVDLNGPGPTNITWEDPGFVDSGFALVFGSRNATNIVTLVDNIALNSGTVAAPVAQYNAREIRVVDNPNSTTDMARISGTIGSARVRPQRPSARTAIWATY